MPCPITRCIQQTLIMPRACHLLLAACLGALAFVFFMQYGFGLKPCILCLWQRGPYAAMAVLSLLALILRANRRFVAALLFSCAACALTGMGLAIFHTGVELHWWVGTASCAVTPLNGSSPDDLRAELMRIVPARCDEIAWTFLGLSMANWNVALSLGLAFFATTAGAKELGDKGRGARGEGRPA